MRKNIHFNDLINKFILSLPDKEIEQLSHTIEELANGKSKFRRLENDICLHISGKYAFIFQVKDEDLIVLDIISPSIFNNKRFALS